MKRISKNYEDEVLFLEKFISQNESILEIGGGTGNYSSILKKKGYDIICSDINDDMLREAKKKGLNCVNLDMRNFEYKKTDTILILFNTFMYNTKMDELKQTVNSCLDNLNDNGKLIIEIVDPSKLLKKKSHIYSLELTESIFLTHITKVKDNTLQHFFWFCNIETKETELDVHKMGIFEEEVIKNLLQTKFSKINVEYKGSQIYFVAQK